MNIIKIILFSSLLLASVTVGIAQKLRKSIIQNKYAVSGKLEGINEGKIYLINDELSIRDSSLIKNGNFYFKGEIQEPMFYLLQLAGKNGGKGFFLEPGSMTVTGNIDSFFKAEITGSKTNNQWKEWSESWSKTTAQAGPMYRRLDSANNHGKVKEPAEERKIFNDGMKLLENQTNEAVTAFIGKYPQSPVGPFIITDRYINYPNPAMEAKAFALVGNKGRQSFYGKKIMEYDRIAALTGIGTTPDFTVADTSGKMLSLSSLRGKYVLVDFWASWCAPCRKENPNVVMAYKKFHSKGFDIVGVSLDTKKEAWEKAIVKDSLNWNHVSDLKGWESGIVKEYGIKAVPTNFLVDRTGKVVAKNLREEALQIKLEELFKASN